MVRNLTRSGLINVKETRGKIEVVKQILSNNVVKKVFVYRPILCTRHI